MTTDPEDPERRERYHHGDLRRALLEGAVELLARGGPAELSVRKLARKTGVSHAAPMHHFGDRTGLLTAVAAEGYLALAAALERAYQETGSFLEVGVAYVRFFAEHPGHVSVMFRPDLVRAGDPELEEARAAARGALYGPLGREMGEGGSGAPSHEPELLARGVAAWSIVHGLAVLFTTGNLPAALGDDPESVARSVVSKLFTPFEGEGERRPTGKCRD